MSKQETRDKILKAGAALVHVKGFNNTGIQEILTESGVPKGSFYFYFKNKEEFGLALIDHHRSIIGPKWIGFLRDPETPSPLARLKKLLRAFHERYEANGYSAGCPIGNLIQEMSDLSPAIRERLALVVDEVVGLLAETIAEAVELGELPRLLEPERTARFIFFGWEGALLAMKLEKSRAPLHDFEVMVFDVLFRGA